MNSVKNSEILFIYEAVNTNPNGDPDNENKPRTDSRGYVEVTDLRLKRFIRDYMETYDHKPIIVKPDVEIETVVKGKKSKKKADKMSDLIKFGIKLFNDKQEDEKKRVNSSDTFLQTFKDIAYFGIVTGSKKKDNKEIEYLKSNYYGAVQFQYGRSFNIGEIETYAISPVAETLGVDQRLKYGLIGFYGVVNAKTAENNFLTDEDIKKLDEYIINSVPKMSVLSRSKIGHNSLFYVRIEYKKGFNPKDLRRYVSIDKNEKLYSVDDYVLSVKELFAHIKAYDAEIEKVYFYHNSDLNLKIDNSIPENEKFVKIDISTREK
jgi:CRISPR-associated protein Csh2